MKELVKIEYVDDFPIYDVTVEDDHCFELYNGVIAHNSMYPKDIVSGGCLGEGTEIRMADGSTKEIQNISVGDMVSTKLGDKPVTSIWNPDTLEFGTPDCCEIQFEDGTKIVCSESHPFLVQGKWVDAVDLDVGVDVSVL